MIDDFELTLEEMSLDKMALMLLSHDEDWLRIRDELVIDIRAVRQFEIKIKEIDNE